METLQANEAAAKAAFLQTLKNPRTVDRALELAAKLNREVGSLPEDEVGRPIQITFISNVKGPGGARLGRSGQVGQP